MPSWVENNSRVDLDKIALHLCHLGQSHCMTTSLLQDSWSWVEKNFHVDLTKSHYIYSILDNRTAWHTSLLQDSGSWVEKNLHVNLTKIALHLCHLRQSHCMTYELITRLWILGGEELARRLDKIDLHEAAFTSVNNNHRQLYNNHSAGTELGR